MLTTANMCIPRASLNSSCASMIFILRIHAIGMPEGVTLLEFEGANQEEEPEVQEANEAAFLFPERQAPDHIKPPMFLQIH